MPTNELLEDNESPLVCQLDYDDPDALAADNLRMFGRLYNNDPEGLTGRTLEGQLSNIFTKFRSKLEEALKAQSAQFGRTEEALNARNRGWEPLDAIPAKAFEVNELAHVLNYNGIAHSEIAKCLVAEECFIDSSYDLAYVLWHGIFVTTGWDTHKKTKGAGDILAERKEWTATTHERGRPPDPGDAYTFEDFHAAVQQALVVGSAYYSNEGEWLVQQPRVNIPEETILILKKPARDEYKSTWTYESWREHPYQGDKVEFFESFGILPDEPYSLRDVVLALGLEDKYDIRWVETSAVEGKRDRRAPRLHDRLAAAKTRVFNPSLDAEFWGEQGAGAYLVAEDTGRVLLTLRSGLVNEPGTWGIPGGAIDPGESPSAAARREVQEELGYDEDVELEFELLPAFSKGSFV